MKTLLKTLSICALAISATACGVQSDAKKEVSKIVLDPTSLIWGDSVVMPYKDGQKIVCGHFNAKNALGAYVGNTAYIYIDAKPPIVDMQTADNSSQFLKVWNSSCFERDESGVGQVYRESLNNYESKFQIYANDDNKNNDCLYIMSAIRLINKADGSLNQYMTIWQDRKEKYCR